MSLGVFAAACGIKRAIELKHLGSPNYLKDVVGIIIWHAAELCTTMVCIGIPVCRPLYMRWLDGWVSTKESGESNSQRGGWKKDNGDDSGNSDGVFAMHTIGGSGFKGQKATRDGRGVTVTTEDVDYREDLGPSKERIISVGAAGYLNSSKDSILRTEPGPGDNEDRGPSRIAVRTDFHVEVVGATGRHVG